MSWTVGQATKALYVVRFYWYLKNDVIFMKCLIKNTKLNFFVCEWTRNIYLYIYVYYLEA